mmetsp:Transcript_63636/g.77835  ORF Transcript_63636/g.77835 Transcript_63636/m.77835 type:complete len:243 (-) Transcript_63636:354-1082(-)
MGLKKIIADTGCGISFIKAAYKATPAPLPKPHKITFFQPRPLCFSRGSRASTKQRPRTSTSCSMSRSSFSKAWRLRMYQEPSVTSEEETSNSKSPSPAGCFDQARETKPARPSTLDTSFSATFSDLGLSPSQTTKDSGRLCSPSSKTLSSGPSGAPAATLRSVNSSLSQSSFSFSLSSSSFFFAPSGPLAAAPRAAEAGSSMGSGLLCNSSRRVGKIKTTCELSEASAARPKASLMASSPTL